MRGSLAMPIEKRKMQGIPFRRVEVLASHSSFDEARDTQSRLVEAGIPTERISIVGSRLEPVTEASAERYLRVAVAGLASGALVGAIAGACISAVGFPAPALPLSLGMTLWSSMSGAVSGVWLAVIAALLQRAQGSRTSRGALRVLRYDVLVHADVAARGRAELERRRFAQRARARRTEPRAAAERGTERIRNG